MPVTPFHLGPAMVLKAACPRALSLGIFAIVQVMIDLETIVNIAASRHPIHGGLHTLSGSAVAALAVVGPARAALSRAYRAAAGRLRPRGQVAERLVAELGPVPWGAALTGALFGALSHSLLDAVIHPDVAPLAPWIAGNALFLPGSFHRVHALCAGAFAAGAIAWCARSGRRAAP
ncbi:MAG: hypothetical protein HYV93_10025 [Candidatus Rokubacteria bacterium]|nr:hypothetical protein [Candidatus Rokubacteria bacterium]